MKARSYRRAKKLLEIRQAAWDRLPQSIKMETTKPGSLNPRKNPRRRGRR